MKAATLFICRCAQCPNCRWVGIGDGSSGADVCIISDDRPIDKIDDIPHWCPLPDAPEEEDTP